MGELRNSVLVVEDERAIGTVIAEVLADEGYVVHSAEHGEDALAQLAELPTPALIVLDLNMPVMDGRDFLARRDIDPRLSQVPVLVISADARAASRVADEHGAEFLVKPFKLHQLLHAVGRHCMPDTGIHPSASSATTQDAAAKPVAKSS